MTTRQRELVQSTWEYIHPLAAITGELFYAELFRRDPSLRDFIADKLSAQKRALVPSLSALVRDLDSASPQPRSIFRRHPCLGLDYASPGTLHATLLHVVGESLGPLFTPEVKEAWSAFHHHLCAPPPERAAAPSVRR